MNTPRPAVAIALLLTVASAAPAAAAGETLDAATVLQHVLDARGGKAAWDAVRALRVEGTYSAFSNDSSMTILYMRPDLYRMDYELFGTPATMAFDGKQPWIKSAMLGAPDGAPLEDNSRRDVLLDARFGSLLLDHAARGAAIEYGGAAKVEGQPVHVLRVAPKDSPAETWYIDAKSWLELKRVAPVYDIFSGPDVELEMEVFYMDFRKVDGVVLPFREERHFGTRYHVYEAARIEVNPSLDRAAFALPAKAPAP